MELLLIVGVLSFPCFVLVFLLAVEGCEMSVAKLVLSTFSMDGKHHTLTDSKRADTKKRVAVLHPYLAACKPSINIQGSWVIDALVRWLLCCCHVTPHILAMSSSTSTSMLCCHRRPRLWCTTKE